MLETVVAGGPVVAGFSLSFTGCINVAILAYKDNGWAKPIQWGTKSLSGESSVTRRWVIRFALFGVDQSLTYGHHFIFSKSSQFSPGYLFFFPPSYLSCYRPFTIWEHTVKQYWSSTPSSDTICCPQSAPGLALLQLKYSVQQYISIQGPLM